MPNLKGLRVNLPLTQVSIQFKNPGYLAPIVSPELPVKLEAGFFYVYDKARFETPDTLRAPRAEYAQIKWDVTQQTYICSENGIEVPIDDRERDNAVEPLNLDVDNTEIATDVVMNNRERRVATLLTTAGNYGASNKVDYAGTVAKMWSDYGNSDPVTDAMSAREAVRATTGLYPTVCILGPLVMAQLANHPMIKDWIKYTNSGPITEEMLAKLFKVDKVLVGLPMRNSAKQGQTAVLSDVWGKIALFAYIAPRPSIKTATLSYTFLQTPRQTFKYRKEWLSCDIVRVREITAEVMVASNCGYLISNVIA